MTEIAVKIRGHTFRLPCAAGQEDRLRTLADQFAERADEAGEAIGGEDDLLVFLAAGLSLLDEIQSYPAVAEDMENRLVTIEQRAADALAKAARRIEALAARVEAATE